MTGNHFLHTPEALLGRQDSKNPATTCRGLTSTGRPCRRALAAGKALNHAEQVDGVIALLKKGDHIADARYYCWQHKDQATQIDDAPAGATPTRRRTEVLELKNKSSIDTLIQRLGIEERKPDHQQTRPAKPSQTSRPSRPDRIKQQPGFWKSLCCMISVDHDDTIEVIRHRKRVEQGRTANTPGRQRPIPSMHVVHDHNSALSLIPLGTTPQTASALLAELSKPISVHDEEGYIYIFWLTPGEQQDPGEETARSLLSAPQSRGRRLSDVLTEYSYSDSGHRSTSRQAQTILLKIGRANNVTRRMNEWQRQCGHHLNLVRWYPHTSSTPAPSPLPSPRKTESTDLRAHCRPSTARRTSSNVRKVPNVKRVERLIHLELADKQVKQDCATCGREHREWFQVDATESGMRGIDAVVRRWVDWSERQTT